MGDDKQNNNDQNNDNQNNNNHTPFEIALTAIAIIYNLFVLFLAVIWIFSPYIGTLWLIQIHIEPDSAAHNLLAFFACGAIGGASYCLKAIYERLSDAYTPNDAYTPPSLKNKLPRDIFNINVWIFWYLYRPVQSGVLAAVVAGLINMGLFSFSGKGSDMNLNSIYFQLGLGFLVGYGTHEVLKKIEEIISVLFARKAEGSASSPTVPKPEDNDNPQPTADPQPTANPKPGDPANPPPPSPPPAPPPGNENLGG